MTVYFEGIQAGASGAIFKGETLTYLFRSDDSTDTVKAVFADRNCPRIWSKHPTYKWMFCSDISYQQGSGNQWSKWVITAEYKVPGTKWPTGTPTPVPPPSEGIPPDPLPTPPGDDDPETTPISPSHPSTISPLSHRQRDHSIVPSRG